MMNDLNIPFFRKTMFAGMATLFLSTGVTQANPVSAGAVSYTHLDVYKRQDMYKRNACSPSKLPVIGL